MKDIKTIKDQISKIIDGLDPETLGMDKSLHEKLNKWAQSVDNANTDNVKTDIANWAGKSQKEANKGLHQSADFHNPAKQKR